MHVQVCTYISSPYKHVDLYVFNLNAIKGMRPISKDMLATYLW